MGTGVLAVEQARGRLDSLQILSDLAAVRADLLVRLARMKDSPRRKSHRNRTR
jgi:hypothetical protein